MWPDLAEFERDLIRERTNAGLQAARARGRQGGRRKALTDKQVLLAKSMLKELANSIGEVCQTLHISKSTLYRYLKPEDTKSIKLAKQLREKKG